MLFSELPDELEEPPAGCCAVAEQAMKQPPARSADKTLPFRAEMGYRTLSIRFDVTPATRSIVSCAAMKRCGLVSRIAWTWRFPGNTSRSYANCRHEDPIAGLLDAAQQAKGSESGPVFHQPDSAAQNCRLGFLLRGRGRLPGMGRVNQLRGQGAEGLAEAGANGVGRPIPGGGATVFGQ